MKALILNSGLGSRMGWYTKEHPKCMTDLSSGQSILSRQLLLLKQNGITDIVITTGYYDEVLINYCNSLGLNLNYSFVKNPIYDKTNYIYSIYCAREQLYNNDIVLLHGDLVFDSIVLEQVLKSERSCMTVSSTLPLPDKDFKAVIDGERIKKVGIEFFESAVSAQPLYKLNASDWNVWLDKIVEFCERDERKCYAENAFNQVSDECLIYTLDVKNELCAEVDTPNDLEIVNKKIISL
ncbi:MAG: phosphocholine cytidylyltransferase family protein [Clostridiales bacterium]|nr:phosphocholine cytidylyltransferase family protein [Clostridiales bacterium]